MSIKEDFLKSQLQIDLETKYNKNQALPRIKEYLISVLDGSVLISISEQLEVEPELIINLIAQMALRKRATPGVIMATLRKKFDNLQLAANFIEAMVTRGLIKYDQKREDLYTALELPNEIQAEIDLFQYPLPMVHEPLEIRNNMELGFKTIKGSIILKDNHHDNDVNLDHINSVNAIPLSINLETSEFISNTWSDLDKQKDDETEKEFEDRQKAFAKYDVDAKNVLTILLSTGNKFYIPHNYCKRGRCYAKGYHVNPQGTDWNKAVIELANKEIIAI